MAEFIGGNEKDISVGEPIVFENKTECKFEVCAGVVFHKSGVYEVSVVGNRTIVSEVPNGKTGKWIFDGDCYKCNKCGAVYGWWADSQTSNYCPNCGADMRGK